MFSLRLLGGAMIEGPEGPLGGRASQRRRLALLSLLARGRDRPVSRDKLLGLLWPETDSDRARHSATRSSRISSPASERLENTASRSRFGVNRPRASWSCTIRSPVRVRSVRSVRSSPMMRS